MKYSRSCSRCRFRVKAARLRRLAGSATVDDRRRFDLAVFGLVHERPRSDTAAGAYEKRHLRNTTWPQEGAQSFTEDADQDQESVLRERRGREPIFRCETVLEHLRQHQEPAEGGQAGGSGRAAGGIRDSGATAGPHPGCVDAGDQQRRQRSGPARDHRGRGRGV